MKSFTHQELAIKINLLSLFYQNLIERESAYCEPFLRRRVCCAPFPNYLGRACLFCYVLKKCIYFLKMIFLSFFFAKILLLFHFLWIKYCWLKILCWVPRNLFFNGHWFPLNHLKHFCLSRIATLDFKAELNCELLYV